ncbi:hypothetical protein [Amycolatopsis sp. CA-230715]|uniref:hypothetical protein n=1 Tax=Amycolatopsis sp. CA-230715 TaxID=2745196 RepID=UPI001C034B64|nr:hypothetical protein [Amycolatopsis sp. CA-230715]QWF77438.1 hypothetical protein HUW46_00830 [Amycolatopsis sp. CA-230715]
MSATRVSSDDVQGIGDLARRLVVGAYRRHPRWARTYAVVVGVLVVACLAGAGVRLSPLPLVPLPLFAVAAYAQRRLRGVGKAHKPLMIWSGVFFGALFVGFWLMSVMARLLDPTGT